MIWSWRAPWHVPGPNAILVALAGSLVFAVSGCSAAVPGPVAPAPASSAATPATPAVSPVHGSPQPTTPRRALAQPAQFRNLLRGMPPIVGQDVYGATRAGMLSRVVAHDPAMLYVPDSNGSSVTVISQRTRKIVRVLHAGQLSQHVAPSYDLRHLYTNSSAANELVSISPMTARLAHRIRVPRPYNVYFTPDGKQAAVMSEQHNQIRFSDPKSFKLVGATSPRGCRGPNHADFSANGQYLLVTCEFSGVVVKLSTVSHRTLGIIRFGMDSMPQDIRISPDGRVFYIAMMGQDRVRIIDGDNLRAVGSIKTPKEPHGLYPSRNGKALYVSDRGAGKVSVISFGLRRIIDSWTIPGGGSPDMGGVSADGRILWLSGRYDGVVYGFDTRAGRLVSKIKIGGRPHGLAVWPQPGRYSLGHTGNMR